MSTYSGGSAGYLPLKAIQKNPDSPVVWDTHTGIEESTDTGWCGTIPYNAIMGSGEQPPELARLRWGTHREYLEWQEGGKK